MKTKYWHGIVLLSLAATVQAQVGRAPLLPSSSAYTPYRIAKRGANHAVWERYRYETNGLGRVLVRTNSYVELASGLHHRDSQGNWQRTTEVIDLLPNGAGAVATNGPTHVYFPPDLYDGALEILASDGKRVRSRPYAICYSDGTNTVVIASLTNSIGLLLPSGNAVSYTNTFAGLEADIVCTYRKAGFECDLVFRERPPSPAEYGLDPARTSIQLLTEFLDTPDPVVRASQAKVRDGKQDSTLVFGALRFGPGRAFSVARYPLGGTAAPEDAGTPVYKRWEKLYDADSKALRSFLIEEVPYKRMESRLNELALGALPGLQPGTLRAKSLQSLLALNRSSYNAVKSRQMAKAELNARNGVVLDYTTIDDYQVLYDYTFRADTTYLISEDSYVIMSGETTFEGGTVVKFAPHSELRMYGTVNCKTSPYRMAVLTSMDDDTIGGHISGATGNPTVNTPYYIDWASDYDLVLHDLRFVYAGAGVNIGYGQAQISNCQFVQCTNSISAYPWMHLSIDLRNVLFTGPADHAVRVYFNGWPNCTVIVQNVTADVPTFVEWINYNPHQGQETRLALTNCVLAGDVVRGVNCPTPITDHVATDVPAEAFETVGAGNYYLTQDSPYRNAGTAEVDPDLLKELSQKTTYPPVLYSNVVLTGDTTLAPQAQRDTDLPDLGYHYAPIDYLCAMGITNATLTLAEGVALGFHDYYGIWLDNGAHLVSSGTPLQRNYLVHFSLVQEEPKDLGLDNLSLPINFGHSDSSRNPTASLRFTMLAAAPASSYIMFTGSSWEIGSLSLRDCEIYGGGAYWYQMQDPSSSVLAFKNNLIQYAEFFLETSAEVLIQNNLFRGQSQWMAFFDGGSSSFTVTDNAFDGGSIYLEATISHNAFLNGATLEWGELQESDVVTNLTWESGPLGYYYQPTNSPLIDAGSTTADLAGLYHYTTETNQVKEAGSDLDIGLHYVAVDGTGLPIDTDGDNVPDYLEDANGDGDHDTGERDWQSSENGTTGVPGLKVFTPLR